MVCETHDEEVLISVLMIRNEHYIYLWYAGRHDEMIDLFWRQTGEEWFNLDAEETKDLLFSMCDTHHNWLRDWMEAC